MATIPTASRAAEPSVIPATRELLVEGGLLVDPAFRPTSEALLANAAYMDDPKWARGYFEGRHRDAAFADRWRAAAGPFDAKVVVDVGCGPGNLFAALGGRPKQLIGLDVSRGSLRMAEGLGYTPILADAHDIPLASGCADIVALNATLHHCDDMPRVLSEAGRLVAPGGVLVVDHDPQLSAWNWRGLAMLAFKARLALGSRRSEGIARLKSELHHRPGQGVTSHLFRSVLSPMGFTLALLPHNNTMGAAVFEGALGRTPLKYRLNQMLSGIPSDEAASALSLMCVATRPQDAGAASEAQQRRSLQPSPAATTAA